LYKPRRFNVGFNNPWAFAPRSNPAQVVLDPTVLKIAAAFFMP
jgi:hypothetical protein